MKMTRRLSRLISVLVVAVMLVGVIDISEPTVAEATTIMSANDLILYPAPRNLTAGSGTFTLTDGGIQSDDTSLKAINKIADDANSLAGVNLKSTGSAVVNLTRDESLNEQGYSLTISADGIRILYKDAEGAYYAAVTLYQIMFQAKKNLPYLTIQNDYPDFKYRAFDIDISRNRIPKLDTLKSIVDIMGNLKFNQFFMYLEGYPYAYESYEDAWENAKPLTSADISELTAYAKDKGIELIPAQNSIGHSAKVVSTYPELSDVPTGQVLNVLKPETQTYLSNIYDDLYKGFDTERLQIGGDETTFDLTNGTAAQTWRENNPGKEATNLEVYIDSLKTVYDLAKSKGKKIMYWSDMIVKYEIYDRAKELMPDAVAMNWCYYAGSSGLGRYDYSSKGLSKAGIPFYVCPGDQSWSTIVGDAPTLIENAQNAAIKGKQYGAIGYCMTNWGDGGHYQNLVTSFPGIVYASGLSWCYDTNVEGANSYDEYINKFIYQDSTNTVSQAFSNLTTYKTDYHIGYNTHVPKVMMNDNWNNFGSSSFLWKIMNKNGDSTVTVAERDELINNCEEMSGRISAFLTTLESSNMQAENRDILYRELRNSALTLKVTIDYMEIRSKLMTGGEITEPLATFYDVSEDVMACAKEFSEVVEEFRYIWGQRDLTNNLNSTIYQFRALSAFFKTKLGVAFTFDGLSDDNLFALTPDTISDISSAASGITGYTSWSNIGSYIPVVTVCRIGGTSIEQLKRASESALSIKEETGKKAFAYNTEAAIKGGFYDAGSDSEKLMPIVGFPAILPADGSYTFTAKAKFKSGQAITEDKISVSGYANKTVGSATESIASPTVTISSPDADGWYSITVGFNTSGYNAAALNILPNASITNDTLCVADYKLRCNGVSDAKISSFYDTTSIAKIGDTITVPKAYTNGNEAISVVIENPVGTENSVNIGDSLTLDKAGDYKIKYSAPDATKQLVLTVTAQYPYQDLLDMINKVEAMNLTKYTDETVSILLSELAEAKAVMNDVNSVKADYDVALAELTAAKNGLVLKRAVVSSDKITVTASSGVYQNYVLTNCIDGDINTHTWISDYQTVGDYIQFAFSDTVRLDGTQIVNSAGGDLLGQGELQVSDNGIDWVTVGNVTSTNDQTIEFDAVETRYARILCTKDVRSWWKLSEVVFYINVPDAVDKSNYIVSGMSINKAMVEDKYANAYNSAYPMSNVIDGKTETMGVNAYYFSSGAASRTLTVIDLGGDYELKAVELTIPTSEQINTAFNAISPSASHKKPNGNGSAIYVSNSVPVYTDFTEFGISATSTATDLVRLEIGGNTLSSGNWDPEKRGDVCNNLKAGKTYRYLSIWTPYGGGHAINEIKVKVNPESGPVVPPSTAVEITSFSADASGNLTLAVANAPSDATVYLASYDNNKNMLEIHKVTLTGGVATKKFGTENVKMYKAYIWDSYRPLVKNGECLAK